MEKNIRMPIKYLSFNDDHKKSLDEIQLVEILQRLNINPSIDGKHNPSNIADFDYLVRHFTQSDLVTIVEKFNHNPCINTIITNHSLSEDMEYQIFNKIPHLQNLTYLFIKYPKSNQYLCQYNFLKNHQSLETLKVHFQYDMTDKLATQYHECLHNNRAIRVVELIGWGKFNATHLMEILDGMQYNSTLLELKLHAVDYFADDDELDFYEQMFQSTLQINPNLVLQLNSKNSTRQFCHSQKEIRSFNGSASQLITLCRYLILLKNIVLDDIIYHIFSTLTFRFQTNDQFLLKALIERHSIGHVRNHHPFNSNELIRVCSRWKCLSKNV
ncbi:hypothetical protein BC833DRAFT_576245 [Globomyces pollinis-pini]|nr:hypothetical protein BC833DRAFT_576245 [Globomyces pollinis-pini]